MKRPRVIPALLLQNKGLVKTTRFRDPTYLGDPINVVKIFNDKQVDELIFLDIDATVERRSPVLDFISKIAAECFMPLAYGGGIQNLDQVKVILGLGVEKVSVNTQAIENPSFVRSAAELFGSQSIVVSIDVKKDFLGRYRAYTHGGRKNTGRDPHDVAIEMEAQGAGELFLNSIERDGTMQGYDLELLKRISTAVNIPVVACGGAGGVPDLVTAVREGGASAVAAGSMFVFQGPYRAVLISYPARAELQEAFNSVNEK